jgi:hypothetical protein
MHQPDNGAGNNNRNVSFDKFEDIFNPNAKQNKASSNFSLIYRQFLLVPVSSDTALILPVMTLDLFLIFFGRISNNI